MVTPDKHNPLLCLTNYPTCPVKTCLDRAPPATYSTLMTTIKISSKVEEQVWEELRELARESHQSISGLLTEAIGDYLQKRRVRPIVLKHLSDSIEENEELGRLLAK